MEAFETVPSLTVEKNRDVRSVNSRKAILGAFMLIVQGTPYSRITINAVIARAGVARSTFYEHFTSKEALFLESMQGPFSVLAANAAGRGRMRDTIGLLQHFWSKRSLSRYIFNAAMQDKLVGALAATILQQLPQQVPDAQKPSVSIQLAAAQWVPVVQWLNGSYHCKVEDLAATLVHAGISQ